MSSAADVLVIGSGHNALVCALLLARSGLRVVVLEAKKVLGGATRTERPFVKAPELGVSSGAYLLGLMPPELMLKLGLTLPLKRRDPHYFLPTTDRRYLLIGSDEAELERQYLQFFSEDDWNAHCDLVDEVAQLRDDLAPAWLKPPMSAEETAERYIRPDLRQVFLNLVKGSIAEYLDRFSFKSQLIMAMYATTDAFSGLDGCFDTPGTGHNFLAHSMCRLPGAEGTWMIIEGGLGVLIQKLVALAKSAGVQFETDAEVATIDIENGAVAGVTTKKGGVYRAPVVVSGADPFTTLSLIDSEKLPTNFPKKIDSLYKPGTTLKVNLAFDKLPTFTCLPRDRGQFGPTIHILPQEGDIFAKIKRAYEVVKQGELAEEPTIEWYFHTPIDPSLKDPKGRHNGALFVQWAPYTLARNQNWDDVERGYVNHLLSICDRFAPDTSKCVIDAFVLSPPGIERHFGIKGGHIQHVDNSFAFDQRVPYDWPVDGLFSCSSGCHPAGGVSGAAGHNAAIEILTAMGKTESTP